MSSFRLIKGKLYWRHQKWSLLMVLIFFFTYVQLYVLYHHIIPGTRNNLHIMQSSTSNQKCAKGRFTIATQASPLEVPHDSIPANGFFSGAKTNQLNESSETTVNLMDSEQFGVDHSAFKTHRITIRPYGRLGNQMFALASLLGIAHRSHLDPVLTSDNELHQYFNISLPKISSSVPDSWPKFNEEYPCAYDSRTASLKPRAHIELVGHFQSWGYFHRVEKSVREQFTFKHPVMNIAKTFIHKAIKYAYGSNISTAELVLVGIHIRRGDLNEDYNQMKGYTMADRHYIETAMTFFEAKYNKVLFVVCSDDQIWSRANIDQIEAPIVFSEDYEPAEDLAILSLCNHTIITIGTFGWWAAWLAGGTTIYFQDFPKKHSLLDNVFVPEDYFPPRWIGLS